MVGKIQVIVGGQFGSEGKGHTAAALAAQEGPMLAIRTGGPNAGHTAWGPGDLYDRTQAREFKLRQIPVAPVVNRQAVPAIAARAVVQLDLAEIEAKEVGVPAVLVDPHATILEPAHVAVEEGDPDLAWGSTRKGIGAARADRVHRTASTFGQVSNGGPETGTRLVAASVRALAEQHLQAGHTIQIEAAQGYGLGLHTHYYPKTTSADCRAIDALADVGLSPWEFPDTVLEVWLVVRPFPIRVAGDSGPLKDETTWEALGLPVERTTVTNKVRRVGGWDHWLVREAVRANGTRGVRLWMNMADHAFPWLAGVTDLDGLTKRQRIEVADWVMMIQDRVGAPIHALGTGPRTHVRLG